MSYFQARLAEVQIPPKKPQKYLFHVPRTQKRRLQGVFFVVEEDVGSAGFSKRREPLP